jgi:hypothetical protein
MRLAWHPHPDHGHPVCRHHHPDNGQVTEDGISGTVQAAAPTTS